MSSLPDKDMLVGNPTAGQYKTALGKLYDWIASLPVWGEKKTVTEGAFLFLPGVVSNKIIKCTTGGVTGTAEPIWTDVGTTVIDGEVTWVVCDIRDADRVGGNAANNIFLKDGPTASFRNKLINGTLTVWNEGTAITIAAGAQKYTAEGFIINNSTNVSVTVTKGSLNKNGRYLSALQVTAATAPTSGTVDIVQRVEDVNTLANSAATFSAFFATLDTLTMPVTIMQYFGVGGSSNVITSFSSIITSGTAPSVLSSTGDVPSVIGKTIGDNNYLQVAISLPIRSTNTFSICTPQLEEGSVATSFEERGREEEDAICSRYYEIVNTRTYQFTGNPSSLHVFPCSFRVKKRAIPAIIILYQASSSTSLPAFPAVDVQTAHLATTCDTQAALSVMRVVSCGFAANARL